MALHSIASRYSRAVGAVADGQVTAVRRREVAPLSGRPRPRVCQRLAPAAFFMAEVRLRWTILSWPLSLEQEKPPTSPFADEPSPQRTAANGSRIWRETTIMVAVMEMHQIRYFLALCEELNFTRAAERCNVAQPSLTRAIRLLEEEFGGGLVNRERANTHLTELGR